LFNGLVLGLIIPFWGIYLHHIGLSSSEIGASSALLLTANIIAPFFWAKLASKITSTIKVIRLGIVLAFLGSFTLFTLDTFIGTSIFIFLLSFFWQGINPLVESLTLTHLGKLSHRYGQIRLWGSIGFVLSVSSLGLIFDTSSIIIFPYILVSLLFGMTLCTQTITDTAYSVEKPSSSNIIDAVKKSKTFGLFVAIFLLQVSQGAYISFFSLYLQNQMISLSVIGNLWSTAVIAEVIMFVVVYRLILKFGAAQLLIMSMFLTTIRWLMVALYAELLPIMLIAQMLHAFTYSAAHSAILELIKQHLDNKDQTNGILIYSTVCLGGGTAIGVLVSAFLWKWGSSETFIISAIFALLASFVCALWCKSSKSPGQVT
jgi:PPP family 3-phenylpropionic acid transporter